MSYYIPTFEKIVRFEDVKLLSAVIDMTVRLGVAEICPQSEDCFDLVSVTTGVVLLGGVEYFKDYVISAFVDDEFEIIFDRLCNLVVKELGD